MQWLQGLALGVLIVIAYRINSNIRRVGDELNMLRRKENPEEADDGGL